MMGIIHLLGTCFIIKTNVTNETYIVHQSIYVPLSQFFRNCFPPLLIGSVPKLPRKPIKVHLDLGSHLVAPLLPLITFYKNSD